MLRNETFVPGIGGQHNIFSRFHILFSHPAIGLRVFGRSVDSRVGTRELVWFTVYYVSVP